MLNIILILVLGLFIAFFAAQNSGATTVQLASYSFEGVPLYIVIVLSLLVGLIISWLLSLVDFISTSFTMFGKDRKINQTNKTVEELRNKVHRLEIENAQLVEKSKTALRGPTNQM